MPGQRRKYVMCALVAIVASICVRILWPPASDSSIGAQQVRGVLAELHAALATGDETFCKSPDVRSLLTQLRIDRVPGEGIGLSEGDWDLLLAAADRKNCLVVLGCDAYRDGLENHRAIVCAVRPSGQWWEVIAGYGSGVVRAVKSFSTLASARLFATELLGKFQTIDGMWCASKDLADEWDMPYSNSSIQSESSRGQLVRTIATESGIIVTYVYRSGHLSGRVIMNVAEHAEVRQRVTVDQHQIIRSIADGSER